MSCHPGSYPSSHFRTGQGYIEPLLDVADALPLHMVLIPGGTFRMGSPDDEPERDDTEGPQHEVTVPTS